MDAHKICTDRLHVSITRWKDGKNFLVNKFESREDLIQVSRLKVGNIIVV